MATSRTIRTQISSVKNTQKITKAMQLVAASKIRKAQQRMLASMPYAQKIRAVIGHVANSHSEFHHPYLISRSEVKRVGFIIISSDRGLCGGLNVNLFKKLIFDEFKAWRAKKVGVDICLIGRKAVSYFKRTEFNIVANIDKVGEAYVANIIGGVRAVLQLYEKAIIDRVFIAHNEFINTMQQKPVIQQLLPLEVSEDDSKHRYWDYIYESEMEKLLDTLLKRYLESQVYQAIVDNAACEHAARMVSMKNATDNAGALIDDLNLAYNKSRQAIITKEISEIVGGAQAV